jgi:hypothetical protein
MPTLILPSLAHPVACSGGFPRAHLISPAASHKLDKHWKAASIPSFEMSASADNLIT